MSKSPSAEPHELEIMLPGSALRSTSDGPVLIGGRCRSCEARTFPIHPVCPECMGEDIAEEAMSASGTLYSSSTVHVGPAKWHKPFSVGYVDLDNGVRVFTRLQGSTAIGDRVHLGVAEVGRDDGGNPIKSFIFSAGAR